MKAVVKEKGNDFTVSDEQIDEMFPSDSMSSAALLQKEMHEMAKHIADADEKGDKKKGYSPLIEDGKVFRASATPFVPKLEDRLVPGQLPAMDPMNLAVGMAT